jgi:hypothetical protein
MSSIFIEKTKRYRKERKKEEDENRDRRSRDMDSCGKEAEHSQSGG